MFLTDEELRSVGFKKVGINVKISDKASIYTPENIELGNNIRIDDFCLLNGKITLGNNVQITVYCYLDGGKTGIIMDDFTTMAYKSMAFTGTDDYLGNSLTNATIPFKYKPDWKELPIHIKKHSIIGAGCIIFPGVTLEEGTSVGAGSLINCSTEAWSIYAGTPATKKGKRSKKLLELEKQYLEDRKK